MLAELIGVALLPFALSPRRYDDEGPPEESAAQARYKDRRNVLHTEFCRLLQQLCSVQPGLELTRAPPIGCDLRHMASP